MRKFMPTKGDSQESALTEPSTDFGGISDLETKAPAVFWRRLERRVAPDSSTALETLKNGRFKGF
jgi:hypothetical protein